MGAIGHSELARGAVRFDLVMAAGMRSGYLCSVLAVLTGMLAGLVHVVSGPDHAAAVLPLAAHAPQRASSLGASWGLGHASGVVGWLIVACVLRQSLWIERVSAVAELLVGVSLIALAAAMWRARAHRHSTPRLRTALGFGLLHGTAGAGHFLAVLPALGLRATEAVAYAVGYLMASISAMTLLSSMAIVLSRGERALAWFRLSSTFLAFGTGCFWIATWAR